MYYNAAPTKNNCTLFLHTPYFRARAMEWCYVNFFPEDRPLPWQPTVFIHIHSQGSEWHTWGVVGFNVSFITNCFLILTVNNFENRLIFGKIIKCTKMVPFFGPPCIWF